MLLQFAIGAVFGVGLVIAGMSDPAKVLNFLDLGAIATGNWDPSLAFVMAGAIAITFIGFKLVFRRPQPFFGEKFHLPSANKIDLRIVIGPAIFGVGWGLAGFCPGPAFTAITISGAAIAPFLTAMVIGMAGARWLASITQRLTSAAPPN